jgi:two-component system, response regulator RegA
MEAEHAPRHPLSEAPDTSLLLVDSDRLFLLRLAKMMESRGFQITTVENGADALRIIDADPPAFAIIDLRLKDGNGIDLVAQLKQRRPETRAIILTGYANIATAVLAMKRGATDYLAKPSDVDEIEAALSGKNAQNVAVPEHPLSADRVRWEHIQRVFESSERNVSETARRLGMHRRTLQRILAKRAPR